MIFKYRPPRFNLPEIICISCVVLNLSLDAMFAFEGQPLKSAVYSIGDAIIGYIAWQVIHTLK